MKRATKTVPAARVCSVCGAQGPADGLLPWEWDQHLVVERVTAAGGAETAMQATCGPVCRARAGFKERKGAGHVHG